MPSTCSPVGNAACSLQNLNTSSLSLTAFHASDLSLSAPGSYWALNTVEYKVEVVVSSMFSESLGKNATVVSAITMCCGTGAARNTQTYTAASFAHNSGFNAFYCCPNAQITSSNCEGQLAIGHTTIEPQTYPVQNIQVHQIQYSGSNGISGLCFRENEGCKENSNVVECGVCGECAPGADSTNATSTLVAASTMVTSTLVATSTIADATAAPVKSSSATTKPATVSAAPTSAPAAATHAVSTKPATTASISAGNSTCTSVGEDSCSLVNDNKPALTLDAFGASSVDFSTPGSYWALNTVDYKVEVVVSSVFSKSLGKNATVVTAVTLCCGTGAARNTQTMTAENYANNSGLTWFACCANAQATSSNCDGQHATGATTLQPQTYPVQNIQVNQIQYWGNNGISGLCFRENEGCKENPNVAECGVCGDCAPGADSTKATSSLVTDSTKATSTLVATSTIAGAISAPAKSISATIKLATVSTVPTSVAAATSHAVLTKPATTASISTGNSTCTSVGEESCSLVNDNKPALTLDAFGASSVDFSTPGSYWALNTVDYKVE
ncbi:hypothetical protein HDU98_002084, partial [Podochytrium sp. JEL0797]